MSGEKQIGLPLPADLTLKEPVPTDPTLPNDKLNPDGTKTGWQKRAPRTRRYQQTTAVPDSLKIKKRRTRKDTGPLHDTED